MRYFLVPNDESQLDLIRIDNGMFILFTKISDEIMAYAVEPKLAIQTLKELFPKEKF